MTEYNDKRIAFERYWKIIADNAQVRDKGFNQKFMSMPDTNLATE